MLCKVTGQIVEIPESTLEIRTSDGPYYVDYDLSQDWTGLTKTAKIKLRFTDTVISAPISERLEIPQAFLFDGAEFVVGLYGETTGIHKPTLWSNVIKVRVIN